jgi:hypothetical protein
MMVRSGLFLQERRVNMNNKSILNKSETDWARIDAMTDADIDLSDCPEVTSEMFAGAVVRRSANNRAKVTVMITYGRLRQR